MSQTWKTVRVFISSTFRDMQSERDWLVRFVFPKLRQELLQRRIHLVDVDLRWGVTSEQDALSVCREVVDECRPRFLCMLGGRYGWVPPGKTRSITADEVHYGVLDRDLKSRGFAYFYFRDPSATAAMVEVTPGEFREPAGSHGAVALAELKTAIIEAGLQPFIYRAQWDDQSRRLIGLKEFGDRVYADLKQSIDQEFGPATGEKPDEFTEENAAMEAFIEERVQRFVLGSRQPVWNELRLHAEGTGGNGYLCLTGAAGSGKSALLGKFCQDYREAHPQDLVIPHFVGASPGSTDVRWTLRRLCHEIYEGCKLGEDKESKLLAVSGGDEDARKGRLEIEAEYEIPDDPEKLRVQFLRFLDKSTGKKRVVILLDAINQFDPTNQLAGWSWLPEELSATARIILSTMSEVRSQRSEARGQRSVISDQSSVISGQQTVQSPTSKVRSPLDALRHRRNPPREIGLKRLTAEDAEAIIREFLHRYRKSMTDDQRAALLAKADAGTPLYLLVALEELRTLGTYEEITDRIAQLPRDTRALFIWILKRLEDDDGFRDASGRKIGRELVSRFVSLMGASRHGLSQQELVELLSPGDPQGNVAALAQLLRPYLMHRGELLDFYHGEFRKAAATAYLPSESQRLAAHDQLATYFRDKADPDQNQSWKGDSPRPFLEVVFHLIGAQRSDDYCQTLCDLRLIEARCRLGQVFELIADYQLAQKNLPEAQADFREERAREERVQRWTAEITEYARQWSDRRDRLAKGEAVTELEPKLPEPVPTCEMWSEEKIQAECERIIHTPTRRDRLEAFAGFVRGQCYALLHFGERPGFVVQHAFNQTPDGVVHEAADRLRDSAGVPLLLRCWAPKAPSNVKPALLRTLTGHTDEVFCVSVTPDGRGAVSGSKDKTVRIWDLRSGRCLHKMEGHKAEVLSVSVTADGRRAVSGSADRTLRIWDLESGQSVGTLTGHSEAVSSVSVTPDGGRAVSGSGETIRVWDVRSMLCLATLEVHGGVGSVTITPDGRRVVLERLSEDDITMQMLDLQSGQCLRTVKGLGERLSVTPDGRRAVSGSYGFPYVDAALWVWDSGSVECLRSLEGHNGYVVSVSITPDGRRAVSGSEDRTLRVWDLESGRCLRMLEGHSDRVQCVSVTPDGGRAISGGKDTTLRVWDLERGQCLPMQERHNSLVQSVSVTSDGRRALSASRDRTLRVWDPLKGACLRTLVGHRQWVHSVSVTPDGRCAVSGSGGFFEEDNTLRVWDPESGACLRTFDSHSGYVMSVCVTHDGRRAVSGSWDKRVQLWDLESGHCLRILEGHSDIVWCASVTPDGRRAVSGSEDRTLRVWDLESGECLRTLEGHSAGVYGVSVTPDGRRAVSAGDHTVRVWDLESGLCLRTLKGHSDMVCCVSITPDGECALSGSEDTTLRVWNLQSGQCLGVHPSTAKIYSVAFAFASRGNTICIGTSTGDVIFLCIHGVELLRDLKPDVVPDIGDASYEQLLRCGLEFTRREKGDGHKETLAHLAALAAHYEQLGQPEAARPFAEEHGRLGKRKKAEDEGLS